MMVIICDMIISTVIISTTESASRRKWMALVVVCLGQLMMVVDMTIVNVALPVMQRDLRFSQADLTWVVNAYLISYGSFLLLAGRLGDHPAPPAQHRRSPGRRGAGVVVGDRRPQPRPPR